MKYFIALLVALVSSSAFAAEGIGVGHGPSGQSLPKNCSFIGTDSRGVINCSTGPNVSFNEITPPVTGVLAMTFDGVVPPYVGFWTDTDNNPNINVERMRERLLIGNCANLLSTRANATVNTYIPDSASGPGYIPRDSQLCVMDDRGGIAVSGISRYSDAVPGLSAAAQPATIGGAFYVLNDGTNGPPSALAWGLYTEVIHVPSGASLTGQSMGMECDVRNSTTYNALPNPYFGSGGTYCLWLVSGGANSYGPQALNPSAAGIVFLRNGTSPSFNTGIEFHRFGLNGADGTLGGRAEAISMAVGHQLVWYHLSSDPHLARVGALIRSDVVTTGADQGLVFSDNTTSITNTDATHASLVVTHIGSLARNAVEILDAVSASAPMLRPSAQGSANIALELAGRGTGSGGVNIVPSASGDNNNVFGVINAARTGTALKVDTVHIDNLGNYTPIVYTPYSLVVGPPPNGTTPNMSPGDLGMVVITATGGNAGGNYVKLEAVCGSTPGTAKIIAIGGSRVFTVTVIDNIGFGVLGC